jgi:anti-anti-sigma regulatory factor
MQVRQEQGYIILDMDPYIAKDSVPHICKQLDSHLTAGSQEILIDMWEAKTMNSSMASVIVHIIRHISQSQCVLHLVNVTGNVLNALQSLHLTELATVHETALDFEIEKGVEMRSLSHS